MLTQGANVYLGAELVGTYVIPLTEMKTNLKIIRNY